MPLVTGGGHQRKAVIAIRAPVKNTLPRCGMGSLAGMDYLNISDLMGPDWRFLQPYCNDPALTWRVFSGRPMNALERRVTRPALSRYRACLAAVWAARGRRSPVLVSHLPNVSLATAGFARRLAPRVPHVAFAFNYTQVPEGRRRSLAPDV